MSNISQRNYPALGRFAQADSIIPPGVHPHRLGAGGLDRYAYVNNSPMNYVDPSGHFTCSNNPNSDDYCPGKPSGSLSSGNSGISPDYIDPGMLAKTGHGQEVYDFYLRLYNDPSGWWWDVYGSDGHFSAWEFIGMMYGYELDVVASDPAHYENAYPLYMEAMVRNSRE